MHTRPMKRDVLGTRSEWHSNAEHLEFSLSSVTDFLIFHYLEF